MTSSRPIGPCGVARLVVSLVVFTHLKIDAYAAGELEVAGAGAEDAEARR